MILSNFAVPIGLEDIQWRLYIIFLGWIMVEFAGVYFVFPETKGPTLEEIALIFDAPGARFRNIEAGHAKQEVEHINWFDRGDPTLFMLEQPALEEEVVHVQDYVLIEMLSVNDNSCW